MTCIIGYIENDTVYIGGDSAGISSYSITLRKDPKVFNQGPFIMGFTSSFRMGQILMSSKFKIKKQKKEQSDYDYMITDFIDAVRNSFKEGGFLRKKDEEEVGGAFLVGYKGMLYEIHEDFQVGIPFDNYTSVGCGEDLAKGALFASQEQIGLSSKDKMITALKAASHFNSGVSGPYNFVSMTKKNSEIEANKLEVNKKK